MIILYNQQEQTYCLVQLLADRKKSHGRSGPGFRFAQKDEPMLTETGQNLVGDYFEPPKLITAIFPHPIHGRLVERVLLMVSSQINVKGMRYALSWRDHDLAFYQPVAARS